MVSWHSLAIAALSVGGIACCGIGGLTLFAGGMSDNAADGAKAQHDGCVIGAVGLLLLAIAAGMTFL